MRERWKEIKGFPGYEVSDQGRVRSAWNLVPRFVESGGVSGSTVERGKKHFLKTLLHACYPQVHLFKQRKSFTRRIHALVLTAFRGKKPRGMCARHLNGNAQDNGLKNLRWGTFVQNVQDKMRHGTVPHGEGHYRAKLTQKKVLAIVKLMKAKEVMQYKIARQFNVSSENVYQIMHGNSWTALTGIKKKTS